MGLVSTASDNVVPFRRPAKTPAAILGDGVREGQIRRRSEQRGLMDAVYAGGSLLVAAEDRETKVTASRLQVYGFLGIEEVLEDGTRRRLRPSESVRAKGDRPWRLTKPAFGALAVTVPAIDDFLFEPTGHRA